MATDEFGIDDGWWSTEGEWHSADLDAVAAAREELARYPRHEDPPLWFVRTGDPALLQRPADITLESGETLTGVTQLPPDLPLGTHQLAPDDGGPITTLFVTADRAPRLPQRAWGVVAQLYSCRTAQDPFGTFAHLGVLGRWLAEAGGSVLAVNPLGAGLPLAPPVDSPYSPSTRRHLDPLYLQWPASTSARRRTPPALLDRSQVWADGLRQADAAFADHARAAFADQADGTRNGIRPRRGRSDDAGPQDDRTGYGLFCALAEHFGSGWTTWPEAFRRPGTPEVLAFARQHRDRVRWWARLDELVDLQFDAARAELDAVGVTLMGDVTVGFGRDGYDAWRLQDVLALTMSIGAPPDPLSRAGQNWGLPPLNPRALRAQAYQPFQAMLREAFARFGALRIDHILGLFRLFWIPEGADGTHGVYVRFPAEELLDLIVLEAHRASAFVIGEDLGTVGPEVRSTLAGRGIAGLKVGWFDDAPATWEPGSVGMLTTHDLPTVAGGLTGADPTAEPATVERMRASLAEFVEPGDVSGDGHDDSQPDEALAAHRALAASGCDLVLATLEDLTGTTERVNLPGLNDAPNWRVPLRCPVDQLASDRRVAQFTEALNHR